MYHRLMRVVTFILSYGLVTSALTKPLTHFKTLFVFGDSYSDIGEGYLDGNGPTAVAYLAKDLGFELVPSNKSTAPEQSLDFAISGAQTGRADGNKVENALLGLGMKNQVAEFSKRIRSGRIRFDPSKTLFFIAGGLNDKSLPTETTVKNLEEEIRELYQLGGRHFALALLPTTIPSFMEVGLRLNPALAAMPEHLRKQIVGANLRLIHWGPYFDEVMRNPARYGITDTTHACAGREIFHENSTPCATPDRFFFYHVGHPSTAVHRLVGVKLRHELRSGQF